MSTILDNFLDTISSKKPSELLNPATANNLYQTVPTAAMNFVGLGLMKKKNSHTPYVKYTAVEPTKGLMKSVVAGTKAPVSTKKELQTEKHIVVKFKDSLLFSEEELFTIAQAEEDNSRDAEIREASMIIARNVEALKLKNQYTQEKLFWEGCWQARMDVDQVHNGVESEYQLATNVRVLTDLAGYYKWNDHSSSSTADPANDMRDIAESFTGKGAGLDVLYMNLATFNNMIECPIFRNRMQYTTSKIEEGRLDNKPFVLAGYKIHVYNEGYVSAAGTFTNFIPDGYVVAMGKPTGMDDNAVDQIACLNVDAMSDNSYKVNAVYGTFFKIIRDHDPVSVKFLISNYELPVFKNPQLIVVLQVY